MKKNILFKLILFFMTIELNQIDSFSQYSSLKDFPMIKNDKQNIFRDSVTNNLYNISFMDSLYKAGNSPFQMLSSVAKGDSMIWLIKFINKEELSIKSQWLNKKFPLIDFIDLNNNKISTNELTGKILIINCWNITCGPCIKELPYLNALKDSLHKKNFVFLGITDNDSASIRKFFKSDKLKKFLNNQNPSFNFRIIPNQKVLLNNVLGLKGYPTTFIVDKNGLIIHIIEGVNLDDQKNPKIYSEIMEILIRLE